MGYVGTDRSPHKLTTAGSVLRGNPFISPRQKGTALEKICSSAVFPSELFGIEKQEPFSKGTVSRSLPLLMK